VIECGRRVAGRASERSAALHDSRID